MGRGTAAGASAGRGGPGGGRGAGPGGARGGRGATAVSGGRRGNGGRGLATTALLNPSQRARYNLLISQGKTAQANAIVASAKASKGAAGKAKATTAPKAGTGGTSKATKPKTPPGVAAKKKSRRAPPGAVAKVATKAKGMFGTAYGTGKTGGARGPGSKAGRGKAPPGARARGSRAGRGGNGAGGGGGSGGCFTAETLVQMLDGSEKRIIDIKVGEHTKGGIVETKMEFLPTSIYNYKGVEVSGTHWVIEDNQFTEVENSKHGILTDKMETVYCFKTSESRI